MKTHLPGAGGVRQGRFFVMVKQEMLERKDGCEDGCVGFNSGVYGGGFVFRHAQRVLRHGQLPRQRIGALTVDP
jgi:hypothetical protein